MRSHTPRSLSSSQNGATAASYSCHGEPPGEQAGDIFLIEAESRVYKTANCSKNKSRYPLNSWMRAVLAHYVMETKDRKLARTFDEDQC